VYLKNRLRYVASPRSIDSEIGDHGNELIAPAPLLSYLHYAVELERDALRTDLGWSFRRPRWRL
jgi:hypothetical protein